MLNIVRYNKFFLSISALLILASVLAVGVWGLKLNIDFTGGSLLEVVFKGNRPSVESVTQVLTTGGFTDLKIQPLGDTNIVIKTKELKPEDHTRMIDSLKKQFATNSTVIEELRFDSIGGVIGSETKNNAYISLTLVILGIVLYITYAFRHVSKPISSTVYGGAALVALVHDVIITVGAFSFLGHFKGVEIDSLFITALLTVLGFSVHDTIVVFDRIRENLLKNRQDTFREVVNTSINETIVRSINTSATTLIVLLAIFLFGGASISYFVLALIIGIIVGTYSSIFVASPLLLLWDKYRTRRA